MDAEASRQLRERCFPDQVSANIVKTNFFGVHQTQKRSDQIRDGLSFLWQLIRHCLSANRPGTEADLASSPSSGSEVGASTDTDLLNSRFKLPHTEEDGSLPTSPLPVDQFDHTQSSLLTSTSTSSSEADDSAEEGENITYHTFEDPHGTSAPVDDLDDLNDSELEDMIDTFNGVAYVKKGPKELRDKLRFDRVCRSHEA